MPELLIDRILRDKSTWAFQVIQHALAMQAHVPVRIWDMTAARERLPQRDQERDLSDCLKDGSFFSCVSQDVIKRYGSRLNSGWLTLPCNIIPIVDYLRTDPRWLAWEHCFIWNWLDKAATPPPYFRSYFHKNVRIVASPIRIGDDAERYIVIGPVFVPPDRREETGEQTFHDMVEEFVTHVLRSFQQANYKHEFIPDRMILLGIKKGWLTNECLNNKIELLLNAMEAIFSVQCELANVELLSNAAYSGISQIVFMLYAELRGWETNVPPGFSGSTFKFSVGLPSHDQVLEAELPPDHLKWSLTLAKEHPLRPKKKVWMVPTPEKNTHRAHALEKMEVFRGELGLSYANHNDGHVGQHVNELYNWINDAFGIVSAELGPLAKTAESKALMKRLARRISDLFLADMVTISYSRFSETGPGSLKTRILDPAIVYFQDPKLDEAVAKVREKAEIGFIRGIGIVDSLREQSIAYRTLDDGKPHFCRAVIEGESTEFDPKREPLGDTTERSIPKRKASMSIPLRIHGRVYGVMRIDGFHSHQFRLDQMNLAVQLGYVVGRFLFQREVLTKLYNLGELVFRERKADETVYREMGKELASIFLADGAMLWVPSRKSEYSELVAAYYITTTKLIPGDHTIKDEDLIRAVVGEAASEEDMEDEAPFRCYRLPREDKNWVSRYPHRKWLIDGGFNWRAQFPLILRSALSGVPAGGFFQVWSLAGCVSEFVGVCYVCSGLKCN